MLGKFFGSWTKLVGIGFVLAIMAGGLTACATASVNNPVSIKQVYQLRATYTTAFLAPAVAYRQLPRCAPAVLPPCSQASVIVQLQQFDRNAEVALDALERFVRENPTLSPGSVFTVAREAVDTAIAFMRANQRQSFNDRHLPTSIRLVIVTS